MRTVFIYLPVRDLETTRAFYRDVVGLSVAWQMGDRVTAFSLPGTDVELMLTASESAGPPGFMLAVSDVEAFQKDHPGLPAPRDEYEIPDGEAKEFDDPDGHLFGILDERGLPDPGFEEASEALFADWARAWSTAAPDDLDDAFRHFHPAFSATVHGVDGAVRVFDDVQRVRDDVAARIQRLGPGVVTMTRQVMAARRVGPDRAILVTRHGRRDPVGGGRATMVEEWERHLGSGWQLRSETSWEETAP